MYQTKRLERQGSPTSTEPRHSSASTWRTPSLQQPRSCSNTWFFALCPLPFLPLSCNFNILILLFLKIYILITLLTLCHFVYAFLHWIIIYIYLYIWLNVYIYDLVLFSLPLPNIHFLFSSFYFLLLISYHPLSWPLHLTHLFPILHLS